MVSSPESAPGPPPSAWRAIADPVARPGPQAGGSIARIGQVAAVEREAAAPDARRQPGSQSLELRDPLVDAGRPGAGEPRPVPSARHPARRQALELGPDLF